MFFGNFPYECEPDEFQRFLSEAGIEVDLDRIHVKRHADQKSHAIVSLPRDEVAHLVERAISVVPPLYDRKLRLLLDGNR